MKTNPMSPERKRLTNSFFAAWLLDRKLAKVAMDETDGTDDVVPAGAALAEPRGFSSEAPAPGQIRVLSQTDTLTYAVVLARWDERSFLIAPFSRFEEPATDEELKTAFQGGLRMGVLQIWNARSATEATLCKSWLVGTLPKQDLDDALLLWKWSIGDVAELPGRIAERTGVPIYRTDDPRLDYRREALENFAAFDAEDDADAERAASGLERSSERARRTCREKSTGRLPSRQKAAFWENARRLGLVCRVAEPGPVVSAAAASLGSNPRRMFLVDALPARLRGEYSRSEKAVLFSVWDRDRRAKSAALDGFRIRMEGVDEDVPIRGMVARVPVPDPAAGFVLLDSKGKPIRMDPER